MKEALLLILTMASTIVMMITLGVLIVVVQNLIQLKDEQSKLVEMYNTSNREQDIITRNIDYSYRVLEFTRRTTIEVTQAAVRSFIDSKDPNKITTQMVKNLIGEIGTEVKRMLVDNQVMFEQTIFSDEFISGFIVNTITNNVKNQLEKVAAEL